MTKTKKLRIAQIGTIWERTPPKLYGGTERVTYALTEELVKMGHKVTLFATGDSKTSGKLDPSVPHALYRSGVPWTNFLYPMYHVSRVFEQADKFDIIHMHINNRQDYVALPMAGFVKTPTVFTIHFVLPKKGDKDKNDRLMLLEKYRRRNFISISHAQRTLKSLNYVGTAYNGLDFSRYPKKAEEPKDYLVWLGRICHDKGTREAIDVAKKTNTKLILAGKIDLFNAEYIKYYKEKVEPQIDGKLIRYIGEVNDEQKIKLLSGAKAVLHPINWNEPFGLITIEAMACGTPVIAFDRGPVREQITNGKTGFVVKNVNQMAAAVKKIDTLNRQTLLNAAQKKFSAQTMAETYQKIYAKILAR